MSNQYPESSIQKPEQMEQIIKQLEQQQLTLAQQVIIPNETESYSPKTGDLIFTFDVQYENDVAYVAIDMYRWQKQELGIFKEKITEFEDYIPSYFAFREGPVLLKAYQALQAAHQLTPDLIIIDGHGLAHPRKFGVACWMGVMLDIPTIGFAKRTLVKYDGELASERGSTLPVFVNDEQVGVALRTQTDVKPVFVSIGHKISLQQSIEIVTTLAPKYRLIEPLRRADQAARVFAKQIDHYKT